MDFFFTDKIYSKCPLWFWLLFSPFEIVYTTWICMSTICFWILKFSCEWVEVWYFNLKNVNLFCYFNVFFFYKSTKPDLALVKLHEKFYEIFWKILRGCLFTRGMPISGLTKFFLFFCTFFFSKLFDGLLQFIIGNICTTMTTSLVYWFFSNFFYTYMDFSSCLKTLKGYIILHCLV